MAGAGEGCVRVFVVPWSDAEGGSIGGWTWLEKEGGRGGGADGELSVEAS